MSKNKSISIQVQKNDEEFLQAMRAETELDFVELETSSFDGQSEIITLVITLTPLVIGLIGRIVSQQLKARRYIKLVYKGLHIQGLSDDNAVRLIEKLIDKNK